MINHRQLLILLTIHSLYTLVSSQSDEIYPIDISKAYTRSYDYPPSCECAESGVSFTSCSLFKCTCLCDLTANECDYNCCCDSDCSSDQISRFEAKDSCLTEGNEDDTITYCYSSTELAKVNPRPPLASSSSQSTSQKAVDNALCVVKTNAVFERDFFESVGSMSSAVFSTSEGTTEYDYIETASTTSAYIPKYYDKYSTIKAFYNADGYIYDIGNWQVPLKDSTGYCNDNNLVTFESSIPSLSSLYYYENNTYDDVNEFNHGCIRQIPSALSDFENACDGYWSIQRYVTGLKIAKNKDSTQDSYTSITINSIKYRDYTTGRISNVNTNLNNTYNASCLYTSVISSLPILCFNSVDIEAALGRLLASSSHICKAAVQAVTYTVIHDRSALGTITSVLADLVIEDIPFNGDQFKQAVSVKFVSSNGTETEYIRPKSGNPGYLLGWPLLFGYKGLNNTVEELTQGLTYSTPFTSTASSDPSACPSLSDISNMIYSSIAYGYDVITGCILSLNKSELIDLCSSGNNDREYVSQYANPVSGIPYFFSPVTAGYIGMYGNADPLDITQWLELDDIIISSKPQWDESTLTCKQMFAELDYKFLVAETGEKAYPQNKIISAIVSFTNRDVVYKSFASNGVKQSVPLTITVSFISTTANAFLGYVPPPPPVLFKVPYDVFYPFQASAATTYSRPYVDVTLLCVVSCALLLFKWS